MVMKEKAYLLNYCAITDLQVLFTNKIKAGKVYAW